MKNSVAERIRVTKTGKLLRRRMAQGHFRARKSGRLIQDKRDTQYISGKDYKKIKQYLS